MSLAWKCIISSSVAILAALSLHQLINGTLDSAPNVLLHQHLSKATPRHLQTNQESISEPLTYWTIDLWKLFILQVKPREVHHWTPRTRSAKSILTLDFGAQPFPFLNVPLIPTLELRHREGLADCDKIFQKRRLRCRSSKSHDSGRQEKPSNHQPTAKAKKLVKKYKFYLKTVNHNASFNCTAYELYDKYATREITAALQRNNMTRQLVEFSNPSNLSNWNSFGISVQGELFLDERHRYECGGSIYVATNISQPYSPLRGDKVPRYARQIEWMFVEALKQGLIITLPKFSCHKRSHPDFPSDYKFHLVKELYFKIDLIRSQYFPYTTLEVSTITLPNVEIMTLLSRIGQTVDAQDPTSYVTDFHMVVQILPLLGGTDISHAQRHERSLASDEEKMFTHISKLNGFPERGSVLRSQSVRGRGASAHVLALFSEISRYSGKAKKVLSMADAENSIEDHALLTVSVYKNWSQVLQAILDDPQNMLVTGYTPISQIKTYRLSNGESPDVRKTCELNDDAFEKIISTIRYETTMFGFLEVAYTRSIERTTNKLRLLRDTSEWTFSLNALLGYNIKLETIGVHHEELMRHCDELPSQASMRLEEFDCGPLRAHIRNPSFRELGIETAKGSSDSYIKYNTLRLKSSSASIFIDIFPYRTSVLESRLSSSLRAHNLTDLNFIDDHFQMGGHATGRYTSSQVPRNDFEFHADFVWASNRTSDMLSDELVERDHLTTEILTAFHRSNLLSARKYFNLDWLAKSFAGNFLELTNLEIKFDNPPRGADYKNHTYLSNATLITRADFPYLYYRQNMCSLDYRALNYSGTIKQSRQGTTLYNTTYNFASSSTNPLGSFLLNRTTASTSSEEGSTTISDQILFLYPHLDIWFIARSSNESSSGPQFTGEFSESEDQLRTMTKMATGGNSSKTEVALEPSDRNESDYMMMNFKVKKDTYKRFKRYIQFLNENASDEKLALLRANVLLNFQGQEEVIF